MRLYWIKYKIKQDYFHVLWKPGKENLGDYYKKHNPPYHHREIRTIYLYAEDTIEKDSSRVCLLITATARLRN